MFVDKKKDRKKEKEKSSTRQKAWRVKGYKNTDHMPTGIQNIEDTGSLTEAVDQKPFFNFLESSYYCEIKL